MRDTQHQPPPLAPPPTIRPRAGITRWQIAAVLPFAIAFWCWLGNLIF